MYKITPPNEEESELMFSPPTKSVKFLLDYSRSLKVLKIDDNIPVKVHLN
jgi:hypothetical protein